jgi:uncharacterized protein YukE
MDGTFTWMLVLAGAIITLLGAFLAVSEKELQKKRRELASLAAKLSQRNTGMLGADYQNNISKLQNTNKDLQEQLSALSSRLESTEREFAELESERWRLSNLDTEKRQLEASNQNLTEEVAALRQQMNYALKANDDSRFKKAVFDEQLAKMASELNSTTARLEQSQARIKELERATDPLALARAERCLAESRVEFKKNINSLQRELAVSQEKLQAFDTVNRQLLDLEQKYDKALLDNRGLQQEVTRWQERLADSEESQRRLGIIRQQMNDSRSKGDMLDHQMQNQMESLVKLLEIHPSSRQAAQPSINLPSTTSPAPFRMDGLEHVYGQSTGLHGVREYLEPSRYENDIPPIDNDRRESPDNRTAQLAHLLAWIRLHGSNTYQEQIDSLKDLTDLSGTERHVVRDIFLARADDAQKRGRDEEMLRYRNWAKNIVYHTPFGYDEAPDLKENEATENSPKYAGSSDPTAMATTSATAAASRTELVTMQSNGIKSPARNVALGIGIGLGLVLILLLQLFFDASPEITVASDDASTPTISQTTVLPNKQHSSETSRSAIVDRNAAHVEALRSEDRLRGRADNSKTAVRNSAKETAATMNRSQSVWGGYTIVKPAPVFSEPSENSALITSLDPGTQVNVVAARQGWYEIRSRTGRPPGFIRQEAASRNR